MTHDDGSDRPAGEANSLRVAIIGAGISGLSAAYHLRKCLPAALIHIYEATDSIGGILQSEQRDGFLIEKSADSFITDPAAAQELCTEIGLGEELIPTTPENRGAMVLRGGKLHPVPAGFSILGTGALRALLGSQLLSPAGKLRAACEPLISARHESTDESVADFARRRMGREAYERIIQPLVGGIYTADPERLSMQATMQRFVDMEQQHGSLLRGLRKKNSERSQAHGARYGLFTAPRDGMQSLAVALERSLPDGTVCRRHVVRQLSVTADGKWRLSIDRNSADDIEAVFDAVVIATPVSAAARLLESPAPRLAELLGHIELAGASVVCLAYRRDQITGPFSSYGFVVPQVEQRKILAASFSSQKFVGRAPEGTALIRVFLGGALQSEIMQADDAELQRIAHEELADILQIQGRPLWTETVRWNAAMPQYHLGHTDRVNKMEREVAAIAGLELAGNAYHGVGVPQCVSSGSHAATRLADFLQMRTTTPT